jgi:hypothetical protein
MSPHGAVIWALAGVTLAIPAAVAWVLSGRHRSHAVVITDAQLPALPPARPDLDEYTDDIPASGAAWAVGPAPDDEGGENR